MYLGNMTIALENCHDDTIVQSLATPCTARALSGQQSRSLSSQMVNICEDGAVLLLSLNLLFECFEWVRQTRYLYHPSIIVESATLPS